MPLIQWSDALSVKIGKFDDQHKKLIGLINELHAAMTQGKGKEVISLAIKAMLDYTQVHFKDEEAFLKRYNYPELDAQHKEHTYFVNTVLDFKKQYEANSLSTVVQIFNFLNTWLVQHIKKADAKYGQVLAGKPI